MPLVVVPGRALHVVAEADVRHNAEVLRAAPQVIADLALEGIEAGPVGIGRERVRVQSRGDVALTAGIGVVAPGPAQLVRPLEHHEVVYSGLLEANGHAEAGEARADD